jgi:transcriptional regulator with XRE-family HTH domain
VEPTAGGIWLREGRRALGITADELGGALGVSGNTIHAVECGARNLSSTLRARARAYFEKAMLRLPQPSDQEPPPGLVRIEAWVHPGTLTAAIHEAARSGLVVELVFGQWADRPREDAEPVAWGVVGYPPLPALERAIVGALRHAINDHGPITPEHIGSAAKRVLGNLVNARAREGDE